jgi:hypothetical protein
MMQRIVVAAAAAVLAVSMAGCKGNAEKPTSRADKEQAKREAQLQKLRTLKDGEIYVVGRIELIPKLSKEEQNLKTLGSGRLANKAHVFFSDQFVDIREESFGVLKHIAEVPLYEDFIIKRRKGDTLYFSGANIWLESSASYSGHMNKQTTIHTGKLHLPGDMVYKLKPGDKAVYVGTIRYQRDAYNAITKVSYVNEFAGANAMFRKAMQNPGLQLRAVAPAKQKGVW